MSREHVAMAREFYYGSPTEDRELVIDALRSELHLRGQALRARRMVLQSELGAIEKDLGIIDSDLGPPVGLRLGSLLQEAGVTQAYLADNFDVSPSALARFLGPRLSQAPLNCVVL
jgi:hypothetical protein